MKKNFFFLKKKVIPNIVIVQTRFFVSRDEKQKKDTQQFFFFDLVEVRGSAKVRVDIVNMVTHTSSWKVEEHKNKKKATHANTQVYHNNPTREKCGRSCCIYYIQSLSPLHTESNLKVYI